MTEKRAWDIWYAKVYFEDDPNRFKLRPVLLLDDGSALMIMSMMITSTRKWEYEGYMIQNWKYAGLDHESTLMYKKVYPIPEDDFIKRIGTLHPSDIWNLNCLWKNMSASQSKEFPKGPDVESD